MTAQSWAKNWPGVTFGGGLPMLRAARAPSSWPVVLDCTLLELSWTPVVSVSLADIKVERRKCRRIRRWPLASNLASKSEGASRMLRCGRSDHSDAILICLLFLIKIIDFNRGHCPERTRISPLESPPINSFVSLSYRGFFRINRCYLGLPRRLFLLA